MKYSFAALGQNILTRKFGGTAIGVANPYTTGYHFIWFDMLPAMLGKYTSRGNSQIFDNGEISNILAASCMSVTPPGGTLGKIDFTGLGGVKWSVPGNIEYTNEVSIKFLEFSKTPILDIMHGWVQLIRDYRTGTTDLISGDQGDGYSKRTYAGLLYYWTTAPDASTVEFYACYDGVFPTKDPSDTFTSDVESVGKLDIEIPFSIDYAWREPWVLQRCQALSQNLMASKDIIQNYHY